MNVESMETSSLLCSNTCSMILYKHCTTMLVHSHKHTQTHLKLKGVEEPLGGVNIVYSESVPVVPVVFPVGVCSQVHSVTEVA